MISNTYIKYMLYSVIIFYISCADISENKLRGTRWVSNDGEIYCDFTSKQTVEIKYSGYLRKYVFYPDGNKIILTNKHDYSQNIIEYKSDGLHFYNNTSDNGTKKITVLHKVVPPKELINKNKM